MAPLHELMKSSGFQECTTMKYPIGTQFKTHGKHPQVCTVTDILKTYNNAGELVRTRYVSTHEFCGQTVTDRDVCDVTIARGFISNPIPPIPSADTPPAVEPFADNFIPSPTVSHSLDNFVPLDTPPAVPAQLFSELARLFLATEASPLRIANVEFWSDAVGPFADTLSFSVPADKWDARAMGESVAQLARVYPEVTRIVARYASPNWYGVQSDMRSEPPTV